MSAAPSIVSPFDISGHLSIERRDARTHKLLSRWEKKNTIVHGAAAAIGYLLAPNAAFGLDIQERSQLRSMRFGSDNAVPQRTDIDLGAPVISLFLADTDRSISGATYEFRCLMDSATGNGVTYREAAMFTRGSADDPNTTIGSSMFSRQVFPDQDKDSFTELLFRWRFLLSY
jgi:hypothetical protein